ncbi:hypothetical protein V1279_003347 [Bradyrhizobium sp. AZCC 1610]
MRLCAAPVALWGASATPLSLPLERGTFRAGLFGQHLDFRAHHAQSSLELSDAHHSLRS